MGPPALLPIRKEGVLLIFIAFKKSITLAGWNTQPLGPVVSTLITLPPRRHSTTTFGWRPLWTRYWTFGFHKIRRIFWCCERLLVSQEGLVSGVCIFSHFARTVFLRITIFDHDVSGPRCRSAPDGYTEKCNKGTRNERELHRYEGKCGRKFEWRRKRRAWESEKVLDH
jgi:hypothetical protein